MEQENRVFDFIDWTLNNFSKCWGVVFQILSKLIIPILLVIALILIVIVFITGMVNDPNGLESQQYPLEFALVITACG